MKTLTALLAGLGALALSASAVAEVHVGVLGGSSFASLSQQPAEGGVSFDDHSFFGVGAVADVRLGNRLSLRLEPTYVVKGSNFSIEPDFFLFDRRVTGRFRLSYVELPILVRVSSRNGRIRPYAMAGPTLGYLVRSRVQGRDGDVTVDEDGKDLFKKGDFGLDFGAGLLIPAGRTSLFVQGRYTLGLVDVSKQDENAAHNTLKSRTIQAIAGVTIPLGRH
jgi:hypothetical protein